MTHLNRSWISEGSSFYMYINENDILNRSWINKA